MSTGSHPEPDEATHAAEGNVGELLWCSRRTADGNALQPAAKVTTQNPQEESSAIPADMPTAAWTVELGFYFYPFHAWSIRTAVNSRLKYLNYSAFNPQILHFLFMSSSNVKPDLPLSSSNHFFQNLSLPLPFQLYIFIRYAGPSPLSARTDSGCVHSYLHLESRRHGRR